MSLIDSLNRYSTVVADTGDAMAIKNLSENIRKLYADARKLEEFARAKVAQRMAG